jgi:cytochrome b561
MTWLNAQSGYGTLTKLLHWLVVVLFAFQFAAANIMLRLDAGATQLGLSQATYYNWHKSIGLIALVVALLRLLGAQARPVARLGTHAERGRACIMQSKGSTPRCSSCRSAVTST